MARQSYRLLFAAASLVIAVAGILFVVLGNTARAAANSSFVIEASEAGFNPPVCQLGRRDDYFAWKNVGRTVRRIVVPTAGVDSPPALDTGDLQPGESSIAFELNAGTVVHYEDFYDKSLKGILQTPLHSEAGPANCSPQAPTPTPTPPPTPTPAPKPPRCITSPGCAVVAALSRDDQ